MIKNLFTVTPQDLPNLLTILPGEFFVLNIVDDQNDHQNQQNPALRSGHCKEAAAGGRRSILDLFTSPLIFGSYTATERREKAIVSDCSILSRAAFL